MNSGNWFNHAVSRNYGCLEATFKAALMTDIFRVTFLYLPIALATEINNIAGVMTDTERK
jgi:hypothetical protein